jgi:transcriptional regulator with XRE-family HTH domain
MPQMRDELRFGELLREALRSRQEKNSRYSLRAFAAFLEVDHSTLSQILRRQRPPCASFIRSCARKLRLTSEEAAIYIAAEHVPTKEITHRLEQLRHWTAEALAIVRERSHWQIVRLCREPKFRPDTRRIAKQAGVTVDEVNMAFSRLLRLDLLQSTADGAWKELTGLARFSERDFRKLALARVREKAAAALGGDYLQTSRKGK